MLALTSQGVTKRGGWATILPARVIEAAQLAGEFSAIPIREPDVVHTIGLMMPMREPNTPLATALASEARRAAAQLMASET